MLEENHEKLKKFVVFVFKVWRSEFLPDCRWKVLNDVKLFVHPTLLVSGLFCILWHIFVQMEDYSNLVELAFSIAFVISFYQALAVYFTVILGNKEEIFDILEYFDTLIYSSKTEIMNVRRKHLQENTKIALNATKIFLTFIAIGGSVLTTYCLIVSEFHTPMLFEIPGIPPSSIFFYPVNLIYQYVVFISLLENIMTADALIMVTIMYFRGEFCALGEFINQLGDEPSTKDLIRNLYKDHRTLLLKVRQLISSYWHLYFHKLLAITLYLICMYFVFEDFNSSMVAGTFVVVAMITQAFILCFFSQLLENSSESIFRALYLTKWYDMDLKEQKNVLLLMIIFKNSIKVDTFGFGEISIYTFVQICKAAGSYAMVMYTVLN
ncbi:uncharacterized protein LOC129800810 [Phlebotomus papatasi]|uniref:uncharacterized protein LOC129800810 n=1 Tax=Phlebotomus papatasi TaxID=29031 RepID=UPI00248441F1|nr:uncharacterized protein LOC129800810 [Phlebotomus papatasi]